MDKESKIYINNDRVFLVVKDTNLYAAKLYKNVLSL